MALCSADQVACQPPSQSDSYVARRSRCRTLKIAQSAWRILRCDTVSTVSTMSGSGFCESGGGCRRTECSTTVDRNAVDEMLKDRSDTDYFQFAAELTRTVTSVDELGICVRRCTTRMLRIPSSSFHYFSLYSDCVPELWY
jgi:hypothetical protein